MVVVQALKHPLVPMVVWVSAYFVNYIEDLTRVIILYEIH